MRSVLFSLFLITCIVSSLTAQVTVTATADCNSVTAKVFGGESNVWTNIETKKCADSQGPCCKIVKNWKSESNPPQRIPTMYKLYRYDGTVAAPAQTSPTFLNVPHGQYYVRVGVGLPILCPNSNEFISLYGWNESESAYQYVGLEGELVWGFSFYSKKVIVGNTLPNYNDYRISNTSSWYGLPEKDGFCYGEEVMLFERSFERSYDRYWVAIFENGGLNRWESTYWVEGLNDDMSLTALWKKNHPTWEFEEGLTYTVQHVVENSACLNDPWNQKVKNFHILYCANGEADDRASGVLGNAQKLSIVPNPASNFIHIKNLNDSTAGLELQIHDLYGRMILSKSLESSDVDVSDVPTGMYLASVFENGKCLKTEKLVIQK